MERWGAPLLGIALILWFRFPSKRWLRILLIALAAIYLSTMLLLDYLDPLVLL